MDFTLTTYQKLLNTLKSKGYKFRPFADAIEKPRANTIILRHDVDRLPKNALKLAKMEHELGIQSSYYFRALPGIFKPEIIKQIADLGHEIGYHYEDLSLAANEERKQRSEIRDQRSEVRGQKKEGKGRKEEKREREVVIIDRAYELFKKHLKEFRKISPVKTVCMHGSPRSKWDSREIWQKYDYKKLGIIGEPYFDVDYSEIFYLTDTGRRWDGWKMNVRDKVDHQEKWNKKGLIFHTTQEIIEEAQNNELPEKIMINTHPHRWFDNYMGWTKELIVQNLKNIIKRIIVKYRR